MNKTLLLVALVACTPVYDATPDAQLRPDARQLDAPVATLDAAPPQNYGCSMGNLPASRTKTYVTADPVDSQILNELQDQIIGAKRSTSIRRIYPRFISANDFAVAAFVTAGGLTFPGFTSTGSGAVGIAEIPYTPGDRITGISWQACGNGAVDFTLNVTFAASYGVATGNIGSISDVNRAAAWGTVTGSVTPTSLADGSVLFMQLLPTGPGYTVGQISVSFDRL